MAYKENKSNKNRYIDLDMDFNKHPITKDVVRKYDEEAIKRALKNLILLTNMIDRFNRIFVLEFVDIYLNKLHQLQQI